MAESTQPASEDVDRGGGDISSDSKAIGRNRVGVDLRAGDADADPHELLPLKPVDLLVLMTLAREELHGYGIVTDVAERTDGKIQLVPGNLYAVIRRLVEQNLVAEADKRPAPDLDDRRRRYYGITRFGRRVLSAEAERLKGLVGMAEALDLI